MRQRNFFPKSHDANQRLFMGSYPKPRLCLPNWQISYLATIFPKRGEVCFLIINIYILLYMTWTFNLLQLNFPVTYLFVNVGECNDCKGYNCSTTCNIQMFGTPGLQIEWALTKHTQWAHLKEKKRETNAGQSNLKLSMLAMPCSRVPLMQGGVYCMPCGG